MKNVSKIVALILSASAGIWLTGCAAELGDIDEETESALDNVHKGAGITKGRIGAASDIEVGQDSQLGENLPLGGQVAGEIAGGMLGKGLGKGMKKGKGFEQGLGKAIMEKGLGKGSMEKGHGKGFAQGLGKGFSKSAPIAAGERAGEQPALGQQEESGLVAEESGQLAEESGGQVAGAERIEGQVAGHEGQGSAVAGEEDADQASQGEEATAESQEGLTAQPWRRGWYGRGYYGGYGRYGYRYPYGGYRPYYGGYPYYGGGYPYYRHHRRYWW